MIGPLEGILKTDYLVTTTSKAGSTGALFSKASPGSVFNDIFHQNMDVEKSFIGNSKGMQELWTKSKRAHFQYTQVCHYT